MKYRINQTSYIDGQIVPAGFEMEVAPHPGEGGEPGPHQIPGPHWMPLDDEAKAHCEAIGHRYTGEVPDPTNALTAQADELKAKAAAQASAPIDYAKLADAIGTAVAAGVTAAIDAQENKRRGGKPKEPEAPQT